LKIRTYTVQGHPTILAHMQLPISH